MCNKVLIEVFGGKLLKLKISETNENPRLKNPRPTIIRSMTPQELQKHTHGTGCLWMGCK